MPACTVIVSTYNKPDYLALVLQAYALQESLDFELLIADDGSGPETQALIQRYQARFPVALRHSHQPDQGFRKCSILNRCIEAAQSDYLIFSDGDCLPFPDFVGQHLALRQPKSYLSAGAIRLPQGLSQTLLNAEGLPPDCFTPTFLFKNGLAKRAKFQRFFAPLWLRTGMDYGFAVKATFNGLNSSCWKTSALGVKGFDERMKYGSEDCEFGFRLLHSGVRPILARQRIRMLHLDHDRPYVNDADLKANQDLFEACKREKKRQTSYGLWQAP